MNSDVYYRRNLPHIQPKDGMFFITFILVGVVPVSILKKLKEEKEKRINLLLKKYKDLKLEKEKYKLENYYFSKYDEFLDVNSKGPFWLKEEKIAQIVSNKIHALDSIRYQLIAYTIMSTHVHIIFNTNGINESTATNLKGKTKKYPVADTMRLLKGSTARNCNLEMMRKGAFWHHESYDHYVRDESELNKIINYIINNPVQAGLVDNWTDWKFTYLGNM